MRKRRKFLRFVQNDLCMPKNLCALFYKIFENITVFSSFYALFSPFSRFFSLFCVLFDAGRFRRLLQGSSQCPTRSGIKKATPSAWFLLLLQLAVALSPDISENKIVQLIEQHGINKRHHSDLLVHFSFDDVIIANRVRARNMRYLHLS